MDSWLSTEKNRGLCQMRSALMAACEGLPKPPEQAAADLIAACENHKVALGHARWAAEWMLGNPKPEAPLALVTPEEQAVWGFALMAKTKGQKEIPQEVKEFVHESPRLTRELNMMAALLLGTIKNKTTQIGWGSPGSWFYHSPTEHRINMDPAMALIMGLQNARSICLHEIGHAAITKERSPKIQDLTEKLKALEQKGPGGLSIIPKEKIGEAMALRQEYQWRETFWQYTEDAAVNTFAELEGATFPTDISEAILRCYAATLMSREMSRTETEKGNPIKGMLEALASAEGEPPTTPKDQDTQRQAETARKTIEGRMKAAGAAFPISRGWMDDDDPAQWEILGSSRTPETQEIVRALAGPSGLASVQPALSASRLDLLKGLSEEITAKCAGRRNQLCDEIFDRLIKPELEKLPPPPAPQKEVVWMESPGQEGQPQEKPGETGMGESITLAEGQRRLNQESSNPKQTKEDKERTERARSEAIKNSMGSRSPLDRLPDHCTSYEDFLEKCQEAINHVCRLLTAIRNNQNKPGQKTPALLPEHSVDEFDPEAYLRTREKLASGERILPEDVRFFKKTNTKKEPARTRFGFYLDGSGSMYGDQTKKAVMTLLIFAEAARKVGGISVTAVYSGAGATELLLADTRPTEKERRVLASLLSTGHARGDNEICPGGLAELGTALRGSTPPDALIGATHYIFLTDGGSCAGDERSIRKAIETLLDSNRATTFDTVIVDGSDGNPFRRVSETAAPRRETQKPQISVASTPGDIASRTCEMLGKRLRQIKSFAVTRAAEIARASKKTEKILAGQEAGVSK